MPVPKGKIGGTKQTHHRNGFHHRKAGSAAWGSCSEAGATWTGAGGAAGAGSAVATPEPRAIIGASAAVATAARIFVLFMMVPSIECFRDASSVEGFPHMNTTNSPRRGRGRSSSPGLETLRPRVVLGPSAMVSAEKEALGRHRGRSGAMMFGMGETMLGDASRQPERGYPGVDMNTAAPITRVDRIIEEAHRVYFGNRSATGPLEEGARRLHEPLRIALAGAVKAGKSTLLNALVGQDIAPTDATECTRVVTWYRHGATPTVIARLAGGRSEYVPIQRAEGV